ncbi:MAG: pyruvate, phosphate dikinase [Methylocystis sp.]
MTKWCYSFRQGEAEGGATLPDILGSKGAGLAEMARLGLPVPPGFTISSEACRIFHAHAGRTPPGLSEAVDAALKKLAADAGHAFGDPKWPLLVAVRPSGRVSTPGLMGTALNIGLNDETVTALAQACGDERFAYDCYRRLVELFCCVALDHEHHEFEEPLEEFKEAKGYARDIELSAADWREILARYFEIAKGGFPQDPREQLWAAIRAGFLSWRSPRAQTYRALHEIPEDLGVAVVVQAMVFGNIGGDSGAGVAFSRNPSTGAREIFGEYLPNAQGEDLTSGLRTPLPIRKDAKKPEGDALETLLPQAFAELGRCAASVERHCRDMQNLEFTIEGGRVWMLQTKTGKRTTPAALKIAIDTANEGLIDRDAAICRVEPASLDQLLHPTIDPSDRPLVLASGLPASPGAACGEIVFSNRDAESLAALGRKSILVRIETSPDDIAGMHAADGVLTARGGMTSHAAVVARGLGKPCVTAATGLRIDYEDQSFTVGGRRFVKGDLITLDGSSGRVMAGAVRMLRPALTGEFATLMSWADKARRLRVRANAETPADARAALKFGAEGIGLARTEHMFFEGERIVAVREMILADGANGRRAALAKLLPMQREDFKELFEIMAGLPVTIRLLDPPLHEFLPKTDLELASVAKAMGADPAKLNKRAQELSESNPMLGFRGVRLAVAFPEIVDMQARAIFEAAIEAAIESGKPTHVEIMVPLVFAKAELDLVKVRIEATAKAVENETGIASRYRVGAMIELPRAALLAGDIARSAEFLSFGTNDLTQTTLGISRDDAGAFLKSYVAKGVLPIDPFVTLDAAGVGELIALGCERARRARPDITLGVCGEHGGDPDSIAFFERIGVDYVSCSPFRAPIARLSAAQAALGRSKNERLDE